MASRHKHRPILPAIPIPLRDNVPAASFKPRTAVPNSVAVPSLTKSIFKPSEMDLSQTDPDDLFVRFTVPEIRTIQAKLRYGTAGICDFNTQPYHGSEQKQMPSRRNCDSWLGASFSSD